jgi:4-amino-4-deoxy-L-arabinose transferase-like glycosyltransferase
MTPRDDLTPAAANPVKPTVPVAATSRPPDGTASQRTRLAELAVFALALGMNLWSLSLQGYGNTYYAAAVRSMTQSWSNFFFASFDPGGWSTVDKPPLAFWLPALSARIFGHSSWSILWPSAVAGAVTVLLLVITVRRVWGPIAGLAAGAALATMPVAVAVSRSNNPDVWLVLLVVAAACALERAVTTGRLRWTAWMGVFVGAAFLAKLSAAVLVVPALWFAYLVASGTGWRHRVAGLTTATGSFAAVALAWIGAVALVPQSSRPWIGGSTDGTAWNLVVGHNGLGRITGSGSAGSGMSGGQLSGSGSAGQLPTDTIDGFGGKPGIFRLFNAGMGDQVMWLFIIAAVAGLAATWLLLRRRLVHRETASLVAWGGWATTTFVAFSFASGVIHNYYVSLLAPALAALVGVGAALLARSHRPGALIAVATLAGTVALQQVLLRRIDHLTVLRVLTPVLILAAAAALVIYAIQRPGRRTGRVLVFASVASALLAPAAWSISSLGHTSSGSFPEARPVALEEDPTAISGSSVFASLWGTVDPAQVAWLRTQRTTEQWLLAIDGSAPRASAYIIAGDSIMSIGGFTGKDPTMTNAKLAELVRNGRLRFVTVAGASEEHDPGSDSGSGSQGTDQPSDESNPPSDESDSSGGSGPGGPGGPDGEGSITSSTVAAVCENVPAGTWGGTGASTLYDCAGKADAIAAAPTTPTPTPGPSTTSSTGN